MHVTEQQLTQKWTNSHTKKITTVILLSLLSNYVLPYHKHKLNLRSKGIPFLNQTKSAFGSAAALHDMVTVSPFVTFMLCGRSSIVRNTGLTVKQSQHNTIHQNHSHQPSCIHKQLTFCTSITPSLFHCRLKPTSFTNPTHPPRSFTSSSRTASTDVCLDRFFWATPFLFYFSFFFISGPCAGLSWPSHQLLSAR